jgi:hypothetical protein
VSGAIAKGVGPEAGQGPWFDLDEPAYERRSAALSNRPDIVAAAAEYREKGYLVRDFGFSESDLAGAAEYTRSIATARVQDAWLINRPVRNLATHPKVLEFLNDLYQARAFPFQTLNFPRGSQQETHSDTYHFNSHPAGYMCGVWVALEDIHPDSGPLKYFPGSQKLPVFSNEDLEADGGVRDYAGFIAEKLEKAGHEPETAPIRRGQAFIWAANLMHGGSPIADSARTRLSQVTHYYFRNCSYFTPLLSNPGERQLFWREPYDFAAGRFIRSAGKGELPHWRIRLFERMRIWRKQTFTY